MRPSELIAEFGLSQSEAVCAVQHEPSYKEFYSQYLARREVEKWEAEKADNQRARK